MALDTLSTLNTTHIANNLTMYEAARSGFFEFYLPPEELTNLYKVNKDLTSGEIDLEQDLIFDPQNASDYIRVNVVKASVPNFTLEKLEYKRGNDKVNFAGTPEFAEGSLTIDDVVGLNTKDLLYSWLYRAYDPITRKGGRMSEYKKTGYLIEYDQHHEQIRYWVLEGAFLTGISEDDFDKENDGKRQLQATLVYDRAIMHHENFTF